MFDVIVVAGGKSQRTKGVNKLLSVVSGRTVIENAVSKFLEFEDLGKVIIPSSSDIKENLMSIFRNEKIIIVDGGDTRTDSVKCGLKYASSDYVLIHDGARPYVTRDIINNVLIGAKEKGASVPVINVTDSIANIYGQYTPVDRNDYRAVQTPQGFKTSLIKDAYQNVDKPYSDDISLYLTKYKDVAIVEGSEDNIKITYERDLLEKNTRSGIGFDTHKLVEGRKLILGGVEVPFEKGLLGHSDADVLVHAIMDAILSATGLRDIGYYFPDSDEKYKGISSINLLKEVRKMAEDKGYKINNISATLIAEKPKLSKYQSEMVDNIASALGINKDNIGIMFTTTEGMFLEGASQQMTAMATASVIRQ